MARRIGVLRAGETDAWRMAAYSRHALERGPAPTGDGHAPQDGHVAHAAELWIAVARDTAILQGAFQRGTGSASRRGSGGPQVVVGPGTVHVVFSPASPEALGPRGAFDETRIVNRLVRPLLRGLTKAGFLAHFFGRDWIAVAHAPVGWVGFAHDATSRRAVFEAFVGVTTPFAPAGRPSFLGKTPVALAATGVVDVDRLVSRIVDAYAEAYEADVVPLSTVHALVEGGTATETTADPPWAATTEEAIGLIGAGPDTRGILRVGGDLLVSRDALARLEERAATAPLDTLGQVVDEILRAPGVALDGVRSLESIRDVIARARHANEPSARAARD